MSRFKNNHNITVAIKLHFSFKLSIICKISMTAHYLPLLIVSVALAVAEQASLSSHESILLTDTNIYHKKDDTGMQTILGLCGL